MQKSEQINELAAALAKAQPKLKSVEKDSANPHFKSGYVSLTGYQEAVRNVLGEFGLSYVQLGSEFTLVTVLMHTSGQWISGSFPLLLGEKQTMQTLGSAVTYARRFGLASMLGLGAKDDDAEETEDRQPQFYAASSSQRNEDRHPPSDISEFVTEGMAKMLYAKAMGAKWTSQEFNEFIRKQGFKDSYSIPMMKFDGIKTILEMEIKQRAKPTLAML